MMKQCLEQHAQAQTLPVADNGHGCETSNAFKHKALLHIMACSASQHSKIQAR
jgi:hypothetical protein